MLTRTGGDGTPQGRLGDDGAMDAASGASRTAVLVCQGRAAAHNRLATSRFSDPIASLLLRENERAPVEQVLAGTPPKDWRQRLEFELVQATAEGMAPRTLAIDDAARARPARQLVILGAGLDTRAWRLPELAGTAVFEVDHPASQQDKRDRIDQLPPLAGALRLVPVDFGRDRLDTALAAAGHATTEPTTWIWEGVVPYLTREQVRSTLALVRAGSAPGSRLIVNYQQPAVSARLGRLFMLTVTIVARRPYPLAGEPRRSAWTPAAMRRLLGGQGFRVTSDDDLLSLAERLPIEVRHRRSLRASRVLVADLD
jgi:methyltransferase (TIGR00027 family)